MKLKKLFSVILTIAMLLTICTSAQFIAAEEEIVEEPQVITPAFAQSNQLYAQGVTETVSAQAWQKWSSYSGVNAQYGIKYFFLPSSASSNEFLVYNSYGNTVTVNGVQIPAGEIATVPYTNGTRYNAMCNGNQYTYIVYKSDSDASVYVNDTKGEYVAANGTKYNDFYSFLTADKENAVNGSDISIVADGGVTETTLKKIKGRGNTTWKTSDKKPFNLNFNSSVSIAGLESKKFSMMSNSKDGSLLRNKIVYDLADAVEQPYSPDTRFIDLYINGNYRGSFLLSKKVEMGKSSLVSLKDTSDKEVTENFNFLLEVDIWNYQGDTHFTSSMGQEIVLKTPELEDYDPTNPIQKGQMDFITGKYNEFERALYRGNMSELEAICDIESLAKTYLVNEFTKNCDGGLTSTYYTYNAEKGKFYAAPVWDFDSGLGNVDCVRAGASKSTSDSSGWLTKTITNNALDGGAVNTLGQAFNLSGTTSDSKTYEDIVKEMWNDKFVPAINYLLGKSPEAVGRLKTIDEYKQSISNAAYINYIMWGFAWAPLDYSYSNTFDGQVNYMRNWTSNRASWMSKQLKVSSSSKRVYFKNDGNWNAVYCYSWSDSDNSISWPGTVAKKLNDVNIYYYDVPEEHDKIIWNSGSSSQQTVDITLDDYCNLYTPVGYNGRVYDVSVSYYSEAPVTQPTTQVPTTEPVEPTTQVPTTEPVEPTTQVPTTEPVEPTTQVPTTEPVIGPTQPQTKRVYFRNDLNWGTVNCYSWSDEDTHSVVWPGTPANRTSDPKIYYLDVPAEHNNIIWNGIPNKDAYGDQTVDIVLDDNYNLYAPTTIYSSTYNYVYNVSKSYYTENPETQPTTQMPTTEPVEPTTQEPTTEPVIGPTQPQSARVYFVNKFNWSRVYCYSWSDSNTSNSWPGVPAERLNASDNIYYYDVPVGDTYIIFNDGNYYQTENITLNSSNNMYTPDYYGTDSHGRYVYFVNPSYYTEPEATEPEATEPVTQPGTKRVYFRNDYNWSTVNCYSWGSGLVTIDWPGMPAKRTSDPNIYYYDVPAGHDSIIWNNIGSYMYSGCQTVNISLDNNFNLYAPTGVYSYSANTIYNVSAYSYAEPTTQAPTTQEPTTQEPTNPPVLKGDVDLDGRMTIKDATLIQKYIVNFATLSQTQCVAADMDGDGCVTIMDATQIQYILAELISVS